MHKLFIQIPCLNEAETLPALLQDIPRSIAGVESVAIIVVDDGSSDGTADIARSNGADLVERNTATLGLAFSYRRAVDICLREGADIIVNMDGDHQYRGDQIQKLIQPILDGEADIVIGERPIKSIAHFSKTKKMLQRLGSWVVSKLAGVKVRDVTSGFRAMTRDAGLKLTILGNYTYTLESLLQARSKGLHIVSVPVQINPKTRESRLMKDIRQYLIFSTATIIRVFSMYNPLRLFLGTGIISILLGLILACRFLLYYLFDDGSGRIQSLIFAAIFILQGIFLVLAGVLADLIQFNRRLSEEGLVRVRRLEYSSQRQTD